MLLPPFCLASFHRVIFLPRGGPPKLVNSQNVMFDTICSFFGRQKPCHNSKPDIFTLLSILCHICTLPVTGSPLSLWLITSFGKSRGGDDLTSASTPVDPRARKQAGRSFGLVLHCLAHHLGSFGIVWAQTERLFFSPISPRDPKWDIDILAGPVLGLAPDAPECSA